MLGREIADLFARRVRWIRTVAFGTGGLIAALILLLALLNVVRPPLLAGPKYPFQEALDWTDFSNAFSARGLDREGAFIGAQRWFEAGKIDAALGGAFPVLSLSNDPRGFGATRDPQKFVGRDAILVGRALTPEKARELYEKHFDSIEPLPPIAITANGETAFELKVYKGRNFHDPAPEFTLGLRSKQP